MSVNVDKLLEAIFDIIDVIIGLVPIIILNLLWIIPAIWLLKLIF